jgi:small-conductance mechanosensitive channel
MDTELKKDIERGLKNIFITICLTSTPMLLMLFALILFTSKGADFTTLLITFLFFVFFLFFGIHHVFAVTKTELNYLLGCIKSELRIRLEHEITEYLNNIINQLHENLTIFYAETKEILLKKEN